MTMRWRSPKDESVEAFIALGLPRSSAEWMVGLMRGQVTDTMCDLLPGVEHSPAPQSLLLMSATLTPVLPGLTQALQPGVDDGRATSAALSCVLMPPMALELGSRGKRPAGGGRPVPSEPLAQTTEDWRQHVDGGFSAENNRGVPSFLGDLLRRTLGDRADLQWAGWALLAAMHAMDQHDDVLPIPGRTAQTPGARVAGIAFQLGRLLTVAAAVDLLRGPGGGGLPSAR
ncbi:hypothetical protein [Planotetraspora kaengkrachanensis]